MKMFALGRLDFGMGMLTLPVASLRPELTQTDALKIDSGLLRSGFPAAAANITVNDQGMDRRGCQVLGETKVLSQQVLGGFHPDAPTERSGQCSPMVGR